MKERLPVEIENRELPYDKYKVLDRKKQNSYGYVNIVVMVSILSLIITLGSILSVIIRSS